MSTWIEEGIAALEVMKAEIDGALATLHKLQDGQIKKAPVQEELRSAPRQPRPPKPPANVKPTVADQVQIVGARDAAVLARLKRGPAGSNELRDVLPDEGHSPETRTNDIRNALTRLKAKGKIWLSADGWVLK